MQFVCINNFGVITSRRYFLKEIAEVITCILFAVKEFVEICRFDSNLMRFVDSLLLLVFAKMIRARSPKPKAAAIVIKGI